MLNASDPASNLFGGKWMCYLDGESGLRRATNIVSYELKTERCRFPVSYAERKPMLQQFLNNVGRKVVLFIGAAHSRRTPTCLCSLRAMVHHRAGMAHDRPP